MIGAQINLTRKLRSDELLSGECQSVIIITIDEINKKVKSEARRSALSIKISNDTFKVLSDLNMESIKTKDFVKILETLEVSDKKLVVITNALCKNLYLSSRNLEKINLVNAKSFSTYDVMNSNYLLIDKSAVEYLNEALI